MADKYIEAAARAGYEAMVRQATPAPDWSILGWNCQPEKLREDWRVAIGAAVDAWDYGGVTTVHDLPTLDHPTIRQREDGTWERVPLPMGGLGRG